MPDDHCGAPYRLRLFIAGDSPRSRLAERNLRRICEADLADACRIEIIDVMREPQRAAAERIIATPALIKDAPPPVRRIVGDLSDREQVLSGLQLTPEQRDEHDEQRPQGADP